MGRCRVQELRSSLTAKMKILDVYNGYCDSETYDVIAWIENNGRESSVGFTFRRNDPTDRGTYDDTIISSACEEVRRYGILNQLLTPAEMEQIREVAHAYYAASRTNPQ